MVTLSKELPWKWEQILSLNCIQVSGTTWMSDHKRVSKRLPKMVVVTTLPAVTIGASRSNPFQPVYI